MAQSASERLSLSTGAGPAGTGVHLLRYAERSERRVTADLWLTAAFLPLLPLGTWTFVSQGAETGWSLERLVAPTPLRSLATFVVALLAAAALFVPAALAVAALMGNKWLELAGVLGSVVLLVAMLGWLDERRQRIPLRAAAALLWKRRS